MRGRREGGEREGTEGGEREVRGRGDAVRHHYDGLGRQMMAKSI